MCLHFWRNVPVLDLFYPSKCLHLGHERDNDTSFVSCQCRPVGGHRREGQEGWIDPRRGCQAVCGGNLLPAEGCCIDRWHDHQTQARSDVDERVRWLRYATSLRSTGPRSNLPLRDLPVQTRAPIPIRPRPGHKPGQLDHFKLTPSQLHPLPRPSQNCLPICRSPSTPARIATGSVPSDSRCF
jgi:hypothetical protein